MRYLGGKSRIGKKLAEFLTSRRKLNQPYIEPFVGAAGVFHHMENDRTGYDQNLDMILLLSGVRDGSFHPPSQVSEEEYAAAKHSEPSALRAFIGIGCSFGGKQFDGYARSGNTNFAATAKNSLVKLNLTGANFHHMDYRELNPRDSLIYCDPPYAGATKQPGWPRFDSDLFWKTMRLWSQANDVYVSEYAAPDDFECVWEHGISSTLARNAIKATPKVERLFRHKSQCI